jgi:hypothetical protein
MTTPEAIKRLRENPPKQVLRSMRELEILLLQDKANKLRTALGADQSDIDTAFDADRLDNTRGYEP